MKSKSFLRRRPIILLLCGVLLFLFLIWCLICRYYAVQERRDFEEVSRAHPAVAGRLYVEMSDRELRKAGVAPPTAEDCGEVLQADPDQGYGVTEYGDCTFYRAHFAVAEEWVILQTEAGDYRLCRYAERSDDQAGVRRGTNLLDDLTGGDPEGIERVEICDGKQNIFLVSRQVPYRTITDRAELLAFYETVAGLTVTKEENETRISALQNKSLPFVTIRLCLRSGYTYDFTFAPDAPYLGLFPLDEDEVAYFRSLVEK